MKKAVAALLVVFAFTLGMLVDSHVRPNAVYAAGGTIQFWGLIESPDRSPTNVIVLYDPTTGEVWGYPEKGGLKGAPIRIGNLSKLGSPLGR